VHIAAPKNQTSILPQTRKRKFHPLGSVGKYTKGMPVFSSFGAMLDTPTTKTNTVTKKKTATKGKKTLSNLPLEIKSNCSRAVRAPISSPREMPARKAVFLVAVGKVIVKCNVQAQRAANLSAGAKG
jgi:hypothetical protein